MNGEEYRALWQWLRGEADHGARMCVLLLIDELPVPALERARESEKYRRAADAVWRRWQRERGAR